MPNIAFVSSGGSVYGRVSGSIPIAEEASLRPVSNYGVAKASMEMVLRAEALNRGFSFLIIRPSNPYGPGQHPLRQQGVIPIFLKKTLAGQPLEIWGDGTNRKDYIYFEDFASRVAGLVGSGFDNETYNVGSGVGSTLFDIVEAIACVSGRSPQLVYREQKQYDVLDIVLDTRKLVKRIGATDCLSLNEGIKRTYIALLQGSR